MSKSTFFTGQPIFTQLLSLIPGSMVKSLSRQFKADKYCKKFTANDHLVTMLFSTFHHCSSLRELITGLQANSHRLNHLGLHYTPRKSTLADANARRSADFFGALFHRLYAHHYGRLPDSLKGKSIDHRLYIADSTTISLFSSVMAGMGCYGNVGKKKGGAKAHILLRFKDQLPCFIHMTAAKENDKVFLPKFKLPTGSIIVMDRGYNSYKQYAQWSKDKIMWVTRLHPRSVYSVERKLPVTADEHKKGIRSDSIIALGNPKTEHLNAIQKVRMVRFFDKDTKKEFLFISNNLSINSLTICDIYKKRWEIEMFFKRIKQNFNLQYFLGDNENAIKIQIWCGLIADLLIKIIKDKADKVRKRKWAFANVSGLIRLHLTTYIDVYKFLVEPEKAMIDYSRRPTDPQLSLYT